ncbi:hypothetical protein ACNVED_02150 [Legionella sp. D16C41]|uniref:hypothetical protein n=1 Tax=Legionella sp. D16C41 TaxID=3402688 RepID=UPI003AF9BF3A
MPKIYLYYGVTNDNELVIGAAHNFSALSGAGLKMSKLGQPQYSQKLSADIPDDASLENWLTAEFKKINETIPNIKSIVFSSDVNLGHSGSNDFPLAIISDFIQRSFNNIPVQKILFSSTDSVREAAEALKLQDTVIVETTQANQQLMAIFLKQNIEEKPAQADPVGDKPKSPGAFGVFPPKQNEPEPPKGPNNDTGLTS